jgi:SAM-dependent methyltransferase
MSSLALVPCPLCGKRDQFFPVKVPRHDDHIAGYGEIYKGRSQSEWKICTQCGFVHQNPRPTTEALNRYYLAGAYRRTHLLLPEVKSYKGFADWYYGAKVAYVSEKTGQQKGTVFDLGCGYGPALDVFRSRGWRCFGIEADPQCHEFARNQLGLDGVQRGVLTRQAEPAGSIDVVFSNHVFEHLADLDEVMLGIRRLLKPGGWVVTVVPTYYRNRSNLSRSWMNSSHYSLFTHRSLSHLFVKHRFEEVAYTYRGWNVEIDELWHVARYGETQGISAECFEDPNQVRRYLHLINPLRSFVYFPVYSYHSERRQLCQILGYAWQLFRTSPLEFLTKLLRLLSRNIHAR